MHLHLGEGVCHVDRKKKSVGKQVFSSCWDSIGNEAKFKIGFKYFTFKITK